MVIFVSVGGGPTGVELAGTIAEFDRSVLPRDFASLKPDAARVILPALIGNIIGGTGLFAVLAHGQVGPEIEA